MGQLGYSRLQQGRQKQKLSLAQPFSVRLSTPTLKSILWTPKRVGECPVVARSHRRQKLSGFVGVSLESLRQLVTCSVHD